MSGEKQQITHSDAIKNKPGEGSSATADFVAKHLTSKDGHIPTDMNQVQSTKIAYESQSPILHDSQAEHRQEKKNSDGSTVVTNDAGQVSEVDYANGKSMKIHYDSHGKPDHIDGPDGASYNRNAEGNWMKTTFDPNMHNEIMTDCAVNIAGNGSVDFNYTDRRGEQHHQSYDGAGKHHGDERKAGDQSGEQKATGDAGNLDKQEKATVKTDEHGHATEVDYASGKKTTIHNDSHGNPDHIDGPDGATYNRNAEGNWQKITYNPTYHSEILRDGTVTVGADGSIDISYKDISGGEHHQGYDASGKAFKDPGVGEREQTAPGAGERRLHMSPEEAKDYAEQYLKHPLGDLTPRLQNVLDTKGLEDFKKDMDWLRKNAPEAFEALKKMLKNGNPLSCDENGNFYIKIGLEPTKIYP